MLKDLVESISSVTLKDCNNISMDIARELVKEGFDMKALAKIENHIMELSQQRMNELGCKFDKPEDFLYLATMTVEISLYLGINIGRNSK